MTVELRSSFSTLPAVSHRRWLLAGAASLALSSTVVLIGLRVAAVRTSYAAYAGCDRCLDQAVVMSDLPILAALFFLAALVAARATRGTKLLASILAVGVLIVYTIDLGVFFIFGIRLKVTDLFRYGGDVGNAWSVLWPFLLEQHGWLMAAALAGALAGWLGWFGLTMPSRRQAIGGVTLATGALTMATLLTPPPYISAESYLSVINLYRSNGVNQPFSPTFKAALLESPPLERRCQKSNASTPPSIILLVVESLSAKHSKLFSGLADNTPQLDALARDNTYFPTFHANGFTTDAGLIALLAGRPPLPAVGRYSSSHAYEGYGSTWTPDLLTKLRSAGYGTQFFTTGDLGFLGKGNWLKSLGFEHVEGAEQPAYANLPRGVFSDVGDKALYERYLAWWDSEKQDALVFSTLLTVSTHPPFHIPGTDVQGEDAAFRWVDQQIGDFVRSLRQRGFFDNGVLLITGDHRSMTVVPPPEQKKFGLGAISRTPMVVIGPSGLPKGPVEGRWQQLDFQAGLARLAGITACTDALRGQLLGPGYAPAPFVIHVQGIERDRLLVWSQSESKPYQLVMEGDQTHWAEPEPAEPGRSLIMGAINRKRAQLKPVPSDLIDLLIGERLSRVMATH